MNFLSGKRILIISPQPWDHVFISKHHYAEELARNNNQVYFLQPPRKHGLPAIEIAALDREPNIHLVSWRPFFPMIVRFHFPRLYRYLIAWQAKWLRHKASEAFDVVWSFEFNLYPSLTVFGPAFRIFHPVDPLNSQDQVRAADSADLIMSVSEGILNNFNSDSYAGKTLLVNHGICREFVRLAESDMPTKPKNEQKLSVGYFGNLDRGIIDLLAWKQLIESSPQVNFHFWGPYEKSGAFENSLGNYSNVILHGVRAKGDLVREIVLMDAFVLLYSRHDTESDLSNAHKILEYLSTGKVVVSVRIEACEGIRDLVKMPLADDDSGVLTLFEETLKNLEEINSINLCRARKRYALKFSYANNLRQIDNWISGRVKSNHVV